MIRIGVIVSCRAYERVKEIDPVLGDEYELLYYKYKDYLEAERICFENIDKVDAFVFGGWYAIRMIKDKSLFDRIPCFHFPLTAHDELYKLLVKLSTEDGGLNLSRTYIDFLDETNNYFGLKEVISADRFPYTFSYPYDEHMFQRIFDTHIKLWKEGKIDRSITRLGVIEPHLREAGIKTYHVFPSKELIIDTFNSVVNHFKVKELKNNQIAIGHVSIGSSNTSSISFDYETEIKQITLYQSMINFVKEHNIPNIIQKYSSGYEIFITRGILKEITSQYSSCSLLEHLKKTLSFKVSIGWGVGVDIIAARQNAQYAIVEAERHGGDCSFVITEKDQVIGPLAGENYFAYKNVNNPEIEEISKKTNLSAISIQKVIGVIEKLNTNELTASDIALYLGITERSANRIICKLEKNGNAVPLYTKSEKMRGRPKKIYAFNLPTKNSPNFIQSKN